MILTTFEQILNQLCFFLLFMLTLLSWITLTVYKNKNILSLTKISMVLSYIGITVLLIIRWILSKHLPLTNLYESSLFLTWSLILIHFFLETKINISWLSAFTAPSGMLTFAFATFGLPKEMQQSTALVPALQSNWLMMHVSMMLLSYGSLLFGSLLSITVLVLSYDSLFEINNTNQVLKYSIPTENNYNLIKNQTNFLEKYYFNNRKNDLCDQFDFWSYRIIGIGFSFLTVGILSGAVWANEAWGSYWSWDPKETWALITWLIFSIYLHTRMSKGWNGTKSALVAIFGFIVIWICYLGVNLLGKGFHSYGWFS
uniref:Cytochrome c biogenesis protein CcsA n=1 Tax=Netrium digitus TaxID=43946 RepID=A0A191T4Z1_9VIRI|nr:heme attachment to plastid cytochrome c [Netrium digitus]ANI25466.1 heme attachment to plastid cytochrome c [Netrium digitus]